MKLNSDELRLVTLLAVNGPSGEAVALARLGEFFERPCKLRKSLASLERWGLILHDPFQGSARLLVQPVLRALRVDPAAVQPEMFTEQRPLDGALADTLAPPRVPAHSVCVPEHNRCVPEHKMRPAQNVTSTFNRENVSTIKTLTLDVEDLKRRVVEFVGVEDFDLHWSRQKFWSDGGRCQVLDGTLKYLRAGIKNREIKTRTTSGRHLWNQFRHDCRAKGIEAMV